MTVKNLNSIMFEEEKGDTPMALLRGIKFGTESYHVLFKRLCRCVCPFVMQTDTELFVGVGKLWELFEKY